MFRSEVPRIWNCPSSAPKRDWKRTPGANCNTSLRFIARDSVICFSSMRMLLPGRLASSFLTDSTFSIRWPSTWIGAISSTGGSSPPTTDSCAWDSDHPNPTLIVLTTLSVTTSRQNFSQPHPVAMIPCSLQERC
ncbi:hypothetical protein NITLEN_10815 [Nitrospira lenta]|uniref:Uncharacterized protein n=1 Tax=Nitrospira lenta TaxID=1436998 RepID=A0A330L3G3_9BACT|nr:hypothetical protein NITLEN_10815 [Nitrospira lenta]